MLLVYTDINSSRAVYTFQLVFNELLSIDYNVTTDLLKFRDFNGGKIGYTTHRIDNEFFIQRCDLLMEGPVKDLDITVNVLNGQVHLFPISTGSDLNYDIFAAIFYMVSRYEEYLPFEPDINGRYKSTDSLASKNNFLEKPIVNEWAMELKVALQKKYPELNVANKEFSEIITYDVDVAYEYKGKGFTREILSCMKDLVTVNYKRLIEKIKVARGVIEDPWDTYDYISNIVNKHNLNAIFFFLVGKYSATDKNLYYASAEMKKLVKRIMDFSDIGLHPSYSSSLKVKKISNEKRRLELITGKRIIKSRQHFLKFSLPETYQHLITAGIKEDYTMGFADAPGFRAGICTPFYFYDLRNETPTSLRIFPITCMEGNFVKYMQVSPEQAIGIISMLLDRIKAVNGMFISIWHNHTLNDRGIYKGWKRVHDEMIQRIVLLTSNKRPE